MSTTETPRQLSVLVLAGLLLVSSVGAVGLVPGSAVAQTQDGGFEQVDSTTVSTNGSFADELVVPTDQQLNPGFDGTAEGSVTVIIDGERVDPPSELTVTALSDGDGAQFELNGEPATIERYASNNDPPDTLTNLISGTEEIELSVGEEAIDGFSEFQIDNTTAPASVGAGDSIPVNATVTNVGNLTGTQEVNLTRTDTDTVVDTTELRLEGETTQTVEFQVDTTSDDGGDLPLEVQTEDDTAQVSVQVEPANASPTLPAQATDASTLTSPDPTTPGVVVELGDQNVAGELLVTYEAGGDQTVAGTASFDRDAETVTVPIEDTGGFPGNHTAHTLLSEETSSNYQPGDAVSPATADNIIASNTSTVFDASVTIADQQATNTTDQVTVSTADLQPAADSDYVIVVHNDTDGLPVLGQSAVLNGAQEDIPVNITTIDSDTDVVAMLHVPSDGAAGTAIPNADATAGFVEGNVADNATVTIDEPAFVAVSDVQPDNETVTQATTITPQATIENPGDVAADQTVTLEITNTTGETITNTTAVTVGAGESQPVEFDPRTLAPGSYELTIASQNDSATGTLTVVAEATGTVDAESQAVTSSTVVENPGPAGVVVENVSTTVDSVVTITNETGTVVGATAVPATPDATAVNVALAAGFESTTGPHTVAVTPATDIGAPSELPGDTLSQASQDAQLDTAAITLFDGTVAFANQTFEGVQNVSTVEVATADLLPDGNDFVVVVHPYNSTTGEIGDPIGNSNTLTGTNSDVAVTFDEPVSEDGEYIAMLHEAAGDAAFGPQIPHGTATGFIPSGVTDAAVVTINQPAAGAVETLDVAGQGPDATVTDGDNETITVTAANTGDLEGSFEVALTIDNGTEVVASNETVTLAGGDTEAVPFENVTGDLAIDEYTVTGTVGNDTQTGSLAVEAPSTSTLSNLQIAANGNETDIDEGDSENVSVDLTNTGDQAGAFNVTLEIATGGETVGTETQRNVSVGAGALTTVTFDDVTGDLAIAEYNVTVSTDDDTATGTLDVRDPTAPDPAAAELTALEIATQGDTARITPGDERDVTATIENTGDLNGTFETALTIDNGTEVVSNSTTVTVNGGATETVIFENVTGDLAAGEYTVTVTADGDQLTGTLTVKAAPDAIGGDENATAQDLDGDGTFEDVNGDGEFRINDVFELFDNQDAVPDDDITAFDFNDSGEVNVADVQRLLNEFQEGN